MSSVIKSNCVFRSLVLVLLIIPICVLTSELNNVWMQNVSKELSEDLGIIKNEELGISYIKVRFYCSLSKQS